MAKGQASAGAGESKAKTGKKGKTFKRREGHIWLLPHNDAYDPIDGTDAVILGKVTAVLRRM